MNRLLIAIVLCVVFMETTVLVGQESKPAAPSKPLIVEPVTPAVAPATVAGHRELSLREARRLGITLSSVRNHMKALRDEGIIDETSSRAEISAAVLDRISSVDKQSFDEKAGIDLDTLLAFIEKLIDLILRLFVF